MFTYYPFIKLETNETMETRFELLLLLSVSQTNMHHLKIFCLGNDKVRRELFGIIAYDKIEKHKSNSQD